MKKTAISADLHLNNSNFGRMDKNGLSFRTKDFMAAFKFFVDQCIEVIKPDRVVLLGDEYENPHPQNPIRKFLNKQLKRLSNAGIVVEILVGNHDSCYFDHALQPIEEAGFDGVRVHFETSFIEDEDCAMIFLPHTQEVERREVTHKIVVRDFATQHASEISKVKASGLPVLAFGHFGVCGVEMNDGILNHNKEDASLDDLGLLDADAVFLGHYHSDQELAVPGTVRAMYVGSLERSTFNDKSEMKSFVVVETERGSKPIVTRIPYPGARPMVTVAGNSNQIKAKIEAIKADASYGASEPIVKVKFSGTVEEYAEFCKERKGIRDDLSGAKHVAFEKDVTDPDKEAKADSVRQQISKKADVGSSDVLEIFGAYLNAAVGNETERKAVLELASSIVSEVDDKDKTSRGVVPGRTRIHGVKLHNFQMYGVDKNVVELDKGCTGFFGRIGMAKGEDWSVVRDEASVFLSQLPADDRKLISIIGKIEGDENRSNGSGKCFAKNTSILMYDGSVKKVQDIIVGDQVMGPDSKPRNVLSCHGGNSEMYEISQVRGSSYVVNGSHQLVLQTKDKKHNRYGKYYTKIPYKDEFTHVVSVDDYLSLSNTFRHNMGGLHSNGVEFKSKKLLIDPYILGVWLGDGSSHRPSFTNMDEEVVSILAMEASKRGLKLHQSPKTITYNMTVDRKRFPLICAYAYKAQLLGMTHSEISDLVFSKAWKGRFVKPSNASVTRWLRKAKEWIKSGRELPDCDLGQPIEEKDVCDEERANTILCDLKKYNLLNNKHIPSDYKINSSDARLRILAGLIDTDGSYANAAYEITLKPEILSKDIAFVARSLGFAVNIRPCLKTCVNNGKIEKYWRISIDGDVTRIPVKIPRKVACKRIINKNVLCNAIKVNPVGKGDYYGFEVDGDKLFLLDDFTVVHNSSILDSVSWAFYEKIVRDFFDKESSKGSSTTSVVRTINDVPERECYVEVLFSAGKNLYLIRRERKFTSSGNHSGGVFLYCLYSPEGASDSGSMTGRRGADAEQFINQLVSMDFDTFSNSVMFGQSDADKFIRGTDKTKKEIFVKILGLTVLDEYLKESRTRKSLVDKEILSLEAQVSALSSNTMTQDEIEEAERKAETLASEAAEEDKKVAKLAKTIKDLREDPIFAKEIEINSEISKCKALIAQRIEEAKRSCKSASDAMTAEQANLTKLVREGEVAALAVSKAKSVVEALEAKIKSFDEAACKKAVKFGEDAKKAKPTREAEKTALQSKREVIVLEAAELQGTISSLGRAVGKFKKSIESMGDSTEAKCPECENSVAKAHIEEKIRLGEEEIEKARAAKAKVEAPLEGIKAELEEVNRRLSNIEEYSTKGVNAASRIDEHKANLNSLDAAKKSLESCNEAKTASDDRIATSKDTISSHKTAVDKASADAAADNSASNAKIAVLSGQLSAEVASTKKSIESSISAAEEASSKANVLSKSKASERAGLLSRIEVSKKTSAKVESSKTQLSDKESEQSRLGVVEAGFGLDGIRVQIVEKYIPLLNVYVAEFLDVISDNMSMAVVTDGKKDGKMEIKVKGSSGSDPRQLSKGQFAKIKVATDLALGMMSLARNENAPDFVALDEVFAPVDVDGKKAMFDVIAKLQEYFRVVLVISHDAMVQEMIKDTIVVNMVNDTSTIEKQAYER